MAPPTKKQRTGNGLETKKPIVFHCPGQRPDVRLTVFNQVFHVHSTLLKLNSGFFRKFLDSPDKATPVAVIDTVDSRSSSAIRPEASRIGLGETSIFKYDWVTKVDEDDDKSWHLVADNAKNHPYNIDTFKGSTRQESILFERLLRAIYFQSFDLHISEELLRLIDLADYYCALPILSKTLDSVLIKHIRPCGFDIRHHALELFVAAAKLRNVLLFRECLIWVVNPYHEPVFKSLTHTNRKLYHIAKSAHGEISAYVMKVLAAVMEQSSHNAIEQQCSTEFDDNVQESVRDLLPRDIASEYAPTKILYPKLLRLSEHSAYLSSSEAGVLAHLLKSNFVFEGGFCEAGKNNCEGDFLCAYIDELDLPWDVKELDW